MKKIVYLSLLLVMLSVTTSCRSLLEVAPTAPATVTDPDVRKLHEKAYNGDAKAIRRVAFFCAAGVAGYPESAWTACNWYRHGAGLGDAECQFTLGCRYLSGYYGRAYNKKKGLKWLNKAAAQGHEIAKEMLATGRHPSGNTFDEEHEMQKTIHTSPNIPKTNAHKEQLKYSIWCEPFFE